MEKIYKDVEFMGYPKKERIYNNSSVEAIPIEWMKNYIMTTYCTEYDNPQLKGIERLIKDWEKENEL